MRYVRSIARLLARFFGALASLGTALLAGAGVFLIVAGLFYYMQPIAAAPDATPTAGPTASVAAYSLPPRVSAAP